MMPNRRNNYSNDIVPLCRRIVDNNINESASQESKNLLTLAICVLLSIDDPRIQYVMVDKLPSILQGLNVFALGRKEISEKHREINEGLNLSNISLPRNNKFSNNVFLERSVDLSETQSFLNQNEVKSLFITIDENEDYYGIVEQIALELLFLVRYYAAHNTRHLEVESGLEKVCFDNYMGNVGPSYRRHIEEYFSVWYIEKAMKNCEKNLADPTFKTICKNKKGKKRVLDSRVTSILEKINDNDIYNKYLLFVFDRENPRLFFGKRYFSILPEVIQKLDAFDGLLRMIQEYPYSEERKFAIYDRCLCLLNNRFSYYKGDVEYVYKVR